MILGGGRQYRQDNDCVLETATALKQILDCRALSTTMLPDPLLRHKGQRRCLQSSRSKPSDPKAGTVPHRARPPRDLILFVISLD